LLAENEDRCDPPLGEDEVRKIAESVSRYDPADQAGQGKQSSYDIILAYFRELFDPSFRRGRVIYSRSLGREVDPAEACFAPGIELIRRLEFASDVPCYKDGAKNRGGIPGHFVRWAKSAWVDLIRPLEEEAEASEVDPGAASDFEADLRGALQRMLPLGHTYGKDGEQRVERHSVISWCSIFSKSPQCKPGHWGDVRSYMVWFRRDGDLLRVALRVELFGQIGASGLPKTQAKLTQLCELYDLGKPIRLLGLRAVELHPDFVASLLPDRGKGEEDEKNDTVTRDSDFPEKFARENPCQTVRVSENGCAPSSDEGAL
jgi:hypothetical protein